MPLLSNEVGQRRDACIVQRYQIDPVRQSLQSCCEQIRRHDLTDAFKVDHRPAVVGGEGEIRTRDRIAPMPVFKTGAFNRSATSPNSRREAYRNFTRQYRQALRG
jgi:hypothetical protein